MISVDLGGTNSRVAVVGPGGEILERAVKRTAREEMHPDDLLKLVTSVAEGRDARAAVFGVPGRVHHTDGRLEWAPNLPAHWAPHLTEQHLSEVLAVPVALANFDQRLSRASSRTSSGTSFAASTVPSPLARS